MKRKLLFLFCLVLAVPLIPVAAQQTATVKGIVTDAQTGEPLIGVSVVVPGTTHGIATDVDGSYELNNVPEDGSLEFSYLGYETRTVAVGGRTVIDVALDMASDQIEELVVVGYAVQRKRDVLGAVNKVEGAELAQIPVPSAQLALQGRVPGVQVASASGAPGADVSVRVRGVGSINSSNEPLYIIDGIQIEGGLNTVSPNDIEDITVLKDAASTSIYGSRGSNGIVIITTKKGRAGQATVSFNAEAGVQTHGYLTPMVNTADYISIYNEAARNDNAMGGVQRDLIEGSYLDGLADVNHVEELFRVAPLQRYELSVTGGSERTTYAVSGSFFDQDGIIKNSGYKKISFRSNVQSDVKPWLNVGKNVIGSMAETQSIPSSGDGYQNNEGGSAIRYALFRTPAIPTYDADGNYVDLPSAYFGQGIYNTFFGDGYNPMGVINETDRVRNEKAVIAAANMLIKLPLNITSRTVAGVDYMSGRYRQFNQTWGTGGRINNPNSLLVENYDNFNWTFNTVLNWGETFGDHNVSAKAGFEAVRTTTYSMQNTDQNFADDLIFIGKGLDEQRRTSYENQQAFTLASFFGSVNYNYKQKYYAAATVREDGASRFKGRNRWGTFYSVSGGWNIEQENFMQDVDFIDILKLRAGWGTAGNQNVTAYATEDRYMPNYNSTFGGVVAPGYVQTQIGNENLKWETSSQLNVGIDVEMFRQTFGFSIDYFYKRSDNMLMLQTMPPSSGNAQPAWVNNGSMLNTGIDFEMFYRRNFANAGFEVSVNGGWLKNKVLAINGSVPGGRVDNGVYVTLTEAGYPVGSFYMLVMDGIFQDRMEILTSPSQSSNPDDIQPGDVKFVNQNGDLVIDQNDRVHVGSSIPKFTAGINLSGYWKNFDISCFFQGAFGHKIYMQVAQDIEGFYRAFNVTQNYFDNHWTGPGTSNTQPRASGKAKFNNARVSTRFLYDASYMRLKNLQIGYTIPKTEKIGISRLRVYFAATNLFTITKYPGMDPEMTVSANSASEGDRAAGIDWGTYPIARSFTFGINLTF